MFLGRLDLLHQKTKTLNQKLWIDTVNGNPDFSSDLRSIIGGDNAPLNKLKTAIQNYRNAVEVIYLIFGYVDNDSMVKFVHLMRPFKISLQEASTRLIRWKDEVNPRIAAKRQTL